MLTNIPLSLAALAAAAATGATAQGDFTIGQTVETSSGSVQGHAAAERSSVSEYLGIPYAQPPVGDLRFAPPQAVENNNNNNNNTAGQTVIINGTDFGFSCLGAQLYPVSPGATGLTEQGREIFDEWNQVGDKFGEDCLTLNVWTRPQDGDAKKAVLLWIYGGGFFTGGTSVPFYNGRVFADEQDVVVVTFNYRVNMFGFPGSPATDKNLGLLDMRMAIDWVSHNIAQFGGDPDRIVLFGQAAGAMAVDMLLHAFPRDPVVKGAILQSGSATTFQALGPPSAKGAASHWHRIASGLGCTGLAGDGDDADIDDAAILSCMRGKPAADLLRAEFPRASIPSGGAAQSAPRGGFVPTVDDVTVFGDYYSHAGTDFSPVPVLIGTADNEGGLAQALGLANAGITIVVGDGNATATDRQDATYNCPSARRAAKSLARALPVWRYRYFAAFPDARLLAGVESGAWHGSELGVLFGTGRPAAAAKTGSTSEEEEEEKNLGTLMRGMWASFAKDPGGGLDGFMGGGVLSRYSPDSESLIRLGYENKAELSLVGGDSYDGDCAQLEGGGDQGPGQPAAQNSSGGSNPKPLPVASGEKTPKTKSWMLGVVLPLTAAVLSVL